MHHDSSRFDIVQEDMKLTVGSFDLATNYATIVQSTNNGVFGHKT